MVSIEVKGAEYVEVRQKARLALDRIIAKDPDLGAVLYFLVVETKRDL